jgi:hypothetical protein
VRGARRTAARRSNLDKIDELLPASGRTREAMGLSSEAKAWARKVAQKIREVAKAGLVKGRAEPQEAPTEVPTEAQAEGPETALVPAEAEASTEVPGESPAEVPAEAAAKGVEEVTAEVSAEVPVAEAVEVPVDDAAEAAEGAGAGEDVTADAPDAAGLVEPGEGRGDLNDAPMSGSWPAGPTPTTTRLIRPRDRRARTPAGSPGPRGCLSSSQPTTTPTANGTG